MQLDRYNYVVMQQIVIEAQIQIKATLCISGAYSKPQLLIASVR